MYTILPQPYDQVRYYYDKLSTQVIKQIQYLARELDKFKCII